jgi:hypothetical protein
MTQHSLSFELNSEAVKHDFGSNAATSCAEQLDFEQTLEKRN